MLLFIWIISVKALLKFPFEKSICLLLIKNIKSMYRAKGSVRGHEMFFRILFGENSETIYPREQMLKLKKTNPIITRLKLIY